MRPEETLWMFYFYITAAAPNPFTVNRWRCVTDYWSSLSCALNITGPRDSSPYVLTFTGSEPPFSCELVPSGGEHVCERSLPGEYRNTDAVLALDLRLNGSTVRLSSSFQPAENIQPRAPADLELRRTSALWTFSWSSGYETHLFLTNDNLEFQLSVLSGTGSAAECLSPKCKPLLIGPVRNTAQKSVETSWLLPGLQCVQVRSTVSQGDYRGDWGKWSPQSCWTHQPDPGPRDTLVMWKWLTPLCALLALLPALYYVSTARFYRRTMKAQIPSPAPFFKPLFQQHDGHVKEWLSSRCSYVLRLDMFPTETVTVEFMEKEPDHLQDVLSPPGGPQTDSPYMRFEDLDVPYVSPLECPSPGSSSYTQLPLASCARDDAPENSVVY